MQEELRAIQLRGARILWFYPGATIPASTAMNEARHQIEAFHRLNSLRDLSEIAATLF
jgi:hypothetical protein